MRPFSILLIRVLAIYLVLNPLLAVLPIIFTPGSAELIDEWLPFMMASVLIPLGAGLLLWLFAGALAKKIHGNTDPESGLTLSEAGLVRAGSFLIGIYLFIQHLGIVISQYASVGLIAYGSLIVIALSVCLIAGANMMGKLYKKIKYAGGGS
ncbi:MAG: hypothetical protein EA345_18460 [Halomonas sp.]|nr:hypothetical protein [Halomonas sp.]TVP42748.1 MAG: hypothetical protein EA345_18460 [Halomonas sp.]